MGSNLLILISFEGLEVCVQNYLDRHQEADQEEHCLDGLKSELQRIEPDHVDEEAQLAQEPNEECQKLPLDRFDFAVHHAFGKVTELSI